MRVLVSAIASAAILSPAAYASVVYNYTVEDTSQKTDVGAIEYVSISYDTSDRLSFEASLGPTPSRNDVPEFGWFVVSPGPMPSAVDDQLAIFYMDFAGRDLYAYRYEGKNGQVDSGSGSYFDRDNYITTYKNVLDVDYDGLFSQRRGVTVSFNDLDVSALAPGVFGSEWTGVSFEDEIGVWLHFSSLDVFRTDGDLIEAFRPDAQSWFDTENQTTTHVSEPLGLALTGFGLAGGAIAWRRRQKRA
ncbi:hypothetical protein PB2503_01382 [Parvularcula bermudensis HTCC2503]|uniref:PEP-CTERM protein-sorting domain-containing protein n=1 Tax=Parvularcula bermudensis (strain ATCC BAA-594 / HTCC2503 / KCTC 12087) TaxID=314260 RepID=E0TBI0_PARBH|nr:hypothetical protein [Parvularcula bermudensis]ADM08355.1 hypothetical protein PB2503_01382 [Parvularcula bermudensis HTCC2503]